MLIQIAVTVVFLVSGVSKLADMEAFQKTVTEVGVPSRVGYWFAWSLPILEMLLSVAMVFEFTRVPGHVLGLGLLLMFALVTWHVLRRKATIKCSCFGTLVPENFGPTTFARQAILTVGITIVLVDGTPFSWTTVTVTDWVSSITSAVGVVLLYVLLANYHRVFREKRD